jgi:hypothetical protein
MIVLRIVLWAVGAVAAFFLCCFVVGFVGGLTQGMPQALGFRRKPRFRVIRYEEETE